MDWIDPRIQSIQSINITGSNGDGSSGAQESQLNTILKVVAGVRESVDERFALVQEAIAEISDIGQIRGTISEELSNVVHVDQLLISSFVRKIIPIRSLHSGGKDCI